MWVFIANALFSSWLSAINTVLPLFGPVPYRDCDTNPVPICQSSSVPKVVAAKASLKDAVASLPFPLPPPDASQIIIVGSADKPPVGPKACG